jgi:predicted nuclease with TOPRIM domain
VECRNQVKRCKSEIQAKKTRLHQVEVENSELKRRLMNAQKYKDQLKEVRSEITKQEHKVI